VLLGVFVNRPCMQRRSRTCSLESMYGGQSQLVTDHDAELPPSAAASIYADHAATHVEIAAYL